MNAVAEKLPAKSEPVALTPMEMLARAVQGGSSPETLEKLLTLQERWERNEAKKLYDAAMSTAKAKIPAILKTRQVTYSGSAGFKHETLPGIAKIVDPILTDAGLSYRFRTSSDATTVTVTCVLTHVAGHSEETTLSGPHDKSGGKNSIQAVGSSVTYLQRYSLKAALGIAASDDDDAAKVDAEEKITEQQATEIIDLLEANGADRAKFLKWAKVDRVEDIAASHYESCVAAIKKAGKK